MNKLTTTDELAAYFDAFGYHDDTPADPPYWGFAPPTFWEGVQIETDKLVRQEVTRFVDTMRADWRMLRLAWCLVRIWLS